MSSSSQMHNEARSMRDGEGWSAKLWTPAPRTPLREARRPRDVEQRRQLEAFRRWSSPSGSTERINCTNLPLV